MTATGARSPVGAEPPPELVARFKEALERLWPEGGKLGLAVSGGPDSLAMLLLAEVAIPGRFEVATVDHGLRPEAADECAMVARVCAERGIPCEVLHVEVGAGNLQSKAREARYDALANWAENQNLDAIATAHHADDQAETLIMRLNRSSGLTGLVGIRSWRLPKESDYAVTIIRPLLLFRRAELADLVSASGLTPVSDPSNDDMSFDRVRIRRGLEEADWLDPVAIAKSAMHLEDAEGALELHIEQLERKLLRERRGVISFEPLMHPYCAMRLAEIAIRRLGGNPRGSDLARLIDRLWAGKAANLSGVSAANEKGRWTFRPEPPRRTG